MTNTIEHRATKNYTGIMSTIAKEKIFLTIGVMIALTALPVVINGAVNLTPQDCNRYDEYIDKEDGQCQICISCPPGYGSTAKECGNGVGERGRCEPCQEGKTYQDQSGKRWGECNPCRICDNAIVSSSCTPTTNTVCGPCKPGYGSDPIHPNACSLCSHLNDNEKSQECHTTTSAWSPTQSSPSPTSPSPSSPYPYTISTHVYSIIPQQPTTETNTSPAASSLPTSTPVYSINTPQQPSTETNTSPAASGIGAIIGLSVGNILVVLVIGIIIWLIVRMVLKKRKIQQEEPSDTTDSEKGSLTDKDKDNASVLPSTQLAMETDGGGGTPEANSAPIEEGVSDSNAPADTRNGKRQEIKQFAKGPFKQSLPESGVSNTPISLLELSQSINEKCSKNQIEEEETKF